MYNSISAYLQTHKFYALPAGQCILITMVLCKLLAFSFLAIAGTLNSLIARLESLLHGTKTELDLEDYDTYNDLTDEEGNSPYETANGPEDALRRREGILRELERLGQFAALANSIIVSAKGDNLISALTQDFERSEELGGQRKAMIFTEFQRT